MLSLEMPSSKEAFFNPFSPETRKPSEIEALEKKIDNKSLDLDVLIKQHSEIRFDLNRALTRRNEFWVALKNAEHDLMGLEAGSQYFEVISSNPKLKKSSDTQRANLIEIKKARLDQQVQSALEQIRILDKRINELREGDRNIWDMVQVVTKDLNKMLETWSEINRQNDRELPHAA